MDKNLKLLILDKVETTQDRRLEFRMERKKTFNAITASGAKVRHDSGGRFIVVEVPKAVQSKLEKRLPGARIVSLDTDVTDSIADLDPTETLFLKALKIRTSKSYRDAKKKRKFGETPEEKELFTGSCVREEY